MTRSTVKLLAALYDIVDRYRPFVDGPGMNRVAYEGMSSEILSAVRAWMKEAVR